MKAPDAFHTKDELVHILAAWGIENYVLPTKKADLVINFPGRTYCRISRDTHKSTYGKPLFRLSYVTA